MGNGLKDYSDLAHQVWLYSMTDYDGPVDLKEIADALKCLQEERDELYKDVRGFCGFCVYRSVPEEVDPCKSCRSYYNGLGELEGRTNWIWHGIARKGACNE